MEKTLYIRDNAGKIRYWTCRPEPDGLEIEHGVLGGTPQFQYEAIEFGKGGRDQDEQIESRLNSRVSKQLDKGYVEDLRQAETMKPMNRLGFAKPMLAKKSEDVDMVKMMTKPFFLQNKLDGNRCLVHNDGTGLVAYTRNGKEFKTLKHILEPLESFIPAGYTFDGELYVHGQSLQTIVSWGKRLQPNTLKLEFHTYDLISDEPFSARYNELRDVFAASSGKLYPSTRLVLTSKFTPESTPNFGTPAVDLAGLLRVARSGGYEGLMFRSDYALSRGNWEQVGYEDGKRSGSLIKLKLWEDQEFPIVDIQPSADGWAILHCLAPNGKPFTVSCPGDVTFKRHVLNNKHDYIGKNVTVQFAYWTEDGLPFHCVATAIRDYE
ncbi:putative DNA ligase [Cronobacter phage vB_CsaP_Ss1]|nr:putative DNA ligase [Cronobacter phage vB_CsaP_Ss1]